MDQTMHSVAASKSQRARRIRWELHPQLLGWAAFGVPGGEAATSYPSTPLETSNTGTTGTTRGAASPVNRVLSSSIRTLLLLLAEFPIQVPVVLTEAFGSLAKLVGYFSGETN